MRKWGLVWVQQEGQWLGPKKETAGYGLYDKQYSTGILVPGQC